MGITFCPAFCLLPAEAEASCRQTFQDPLCAVEEKSEKMSAPAAAAEGSPTPSTTRPAAEGSEDTPADQDKNEATDSSSTWSPEVLLVREQNLTASSRNLTQELLSFCL